MLPTTFLSTPYRGYGRNYAPTSLVDVDLLLKSLDTVMRPPTADTPPTADPAHGSALLRRAMGKYQVHHLDEQAYRIEVLVPSLSKDDIVVERNGNELVIRALAASSPPEAAESESETEQPPPPEPAHTVLFEHAFDVDTAIEVESAQVKDGVLQVELRKTTPDPAIRITIN